MKNPSSETIAFNVWQASAIALLLALIWRTTMMVGDGYWYIALGRWILTTGKLLPIDPFSFASTKSPFMPHMIGCDLGFAWLEAHAGLKLLIVAVAFISAAAWALPWLYFSKTRLSRLTTFYVLAACLTWLGFRLTHFGVRGQAPGDLGVALLFLCLFRMRQGWKPPAWVPVALVGIWVNLHPSFLLALVAPLGFWIFLKLDPEHQELSPRPYVLFSLWALLATSFSVYSFHFLPEVLRLFAAHTTSFVDVQRPPDFHSWMMPLAVASTFLLVAVRTTWGAARFRRSDVALLLGGLAAAFLARRHASLLALLTVIELGLLLNATHWKPRKGVAERLFLTLTIVNLLLTAWAIASKTTDDHPYYAPIAAEDYLAASGFSDRLFNPYHWGGYLDYRWNGKRKVFIDGRNTLYGNQVLDDYIHIRELGPAWQELLSLYEIETILWESDTKLDRALSQNPAWRQTYRDPQAVIYQRL